MDRCPRFALDSERFLRDHWQQRPLFIPDALPGFMPPIDASTLAGLAMESSVDSRIVERSQETWLLEHGPFSTDAFQRDNPWTLLVQGVDRWFPEVAALRGCVDFLPAWRFDDVMVSYASDGGSVGPHFDRYDVFLLQGEGERLWRVGELCDENTPRLAHDDLNLLRHFVTVEEYLVKPGDVLYIPPGYAHWGIAQGECTTFSLGFRAPRVSDLTARLTDAVLEKIKPELLLEDQRSLEKRARPGELTREQRENARAAVLNALTALDDGLWLGELLTEPFEGELELPTMPLPASVIHSPDVGLLWFEDGASIHVFTDGEHSRVSPELAPLLVALCGGERVATANRNDAEHALLNYLWQCGALVRPEELQ